MPYSDGKYGVIERHWFGLTKKAGGNSADGFTLNETEGTKVTRFYPKGPIVLQKFGVLTLATAGKSELYHVLWKNGSTRLDEVLSSTTSAPWTINSVALDDVIDAGSYLTITGSTSGCSTGSFAYFVDYRRSYDGSKWDQVA